MADKCLGTGNRSMTKIYFKTLKFLYFCNMNRCDNFMSQCLSPIFSSASGLWSFQMMHSPKGKNSIKLSVKTVVLPTLFVTQVNTEQATVCSIDFCITFT